MGSPPPFTTLDMSSPCLLAPMFSDEKRAFNLIEYGWYVMSHFSLVAFRILFDFCQFDYDVFQYGSV